MKCLECLDTGYCFSGQTGDPFSLQKTACECQAGIILDVSGEEAITD